MNFRHVNSSPDRTTLALEGSLDFTQVEEIKAPFLAAVAAHPGTVVVDLSLVTFVASLGMRLFIDAYKLLAPSGGKLIMFRPSPTVRKILLHAGMESVFSIAETEEDVATLTGDE